MMTDELNATLCKALDKNWVESDKNLDEIHAILNEKPDRLYDNRKERVGEKIKESERLSGFREGIEFAVRAMGYNVGIHNGNYVIYRTR